MRFERPSRTPGRALVLLLGTACLAATAVPSVSSAASGAGVVPAGLVRMCEEGGENHIIFWAFSGRIVAGKQGVQVPLGIANARTGCENQFASDDWIVNMSGSTAGGVTYQWTCAGAIIQLTPEVDILPPDVLGFPLHSGPSWLFDLVCTTKGKRGRFALKIVLVSPFNTNIEGATPFFEVEGVYTASNP